MSLIMVCTFTVGLLHLTYTVAAYMEKYVCISKPYYILPLLLFSLNLSYISKLALVLSDSYAVFTW